MILHHLSRFLQAAFQDRQSGASRTLFPLQVGRTLRSPWHLPPLPQLMLQGIMRAHQVQLHRIIQDVLLDIPALRMISTSAVLKSTLFQYWIRTHTDNIRPA